MSKFKPGKAKLRNGDEAVIYEVTSKYIFGRSGERPFSWAADGTAGASWYDLMPPEPERVVFELRTSMFDWSVPNHWTDAITKITETFGTLKRVRVEVTVIE